MDPDKPTRDDPADASAERDTGARRRADGLTAKDSGEKDKTGSVKATKAGAAGPGKPDSTDSRRPGLTEKQRIEARRARQSRRRRKPVEGNPLSKGLRATGQEIRRTASFLGNAVIAALAALGPAFSAVGMGLVWLIEQVGKGLKAAHRLARRALAGLGRAVVALDRVITPGRALILIAALAAILLGVSQFKGLGQIEIGQSGYAGFEDLARAPAIDHTTPAGVHTKILVPIAAVAFAAVIVILLGSIASTAKRFSSLRRLAAMVLVAIGILTLVVALLIDLPDAKDTTEASLAYSGVVAVLLSGFWLELAAGAALTVSGIALLFQPAANRAREPRPERSKSSREGSRADDSPGPGAPAGRVSATRSTGRGAPPGPATGHGPATGSRA